MDWLLHASGMEALMLSLLVYAVNVPLGYWRASAKARGSRVEVLLAIHAAVPLAAWARREAEMGLLGLPVFISLYFLGQATGSVIYQGLARKTVREWSP